MSSSSGRRWLVLYGNVGRALEDAWGRSGIAGSEPSSIARTCYRDDLACVVEKYGRGMGEEVHPEMAVQYFYVSRHERQH